MQHENTILLGDSAERLKELADNSVDLIACDPPYAIGFMGRDWDKALPPVEIWKESLRVLKPGAFAFIMSSPRQDVLSQMIVRIGEAGFDTNFTSIYWTYKSGFPKAMNIRLAGERRGERRGETTGELEGSYAGFQPKPAVEAVIVAMKPLSEKTFLDQALENGKGVTWLDDAKLPGDQDRFPANVLVSDQALAGNSKYFDLDAWWAERLNELPADVRNVYPFLVVPKPSKAEKNKGLESFTARNHMRVNAPRASEDEKHATLHGNTHPTVKPIALMSYLVTLGSRPGDLVLDPFVGSGTTCIAAKLLSRRYLGIERDPESWKIAAARVAAWQPDHTLPFAS